MHERAPVSFAETRSTDETTVSLYFSSDVRMGMFCETTLSMRESPIACSVEQVVRMAALLITGQGRTLRQAVPADVQVSPA